VLQNSLTIIPHFENRALPIICGLSIKGVGKISLPISDHDVFSLKDPTVSYKTNDDVFTNVYQIEAQDLAIQNPAWTASLQKLLVPIASKMGIPPSLLSAQLDSLYLFEKGSFIDWCSSIEERPVIGTLLIQLPSEFSGGLIRVYDGEEGEEEDESKITCFGMGQSTGKSEYTCHFLCHYGDCQYEMQKIKSGRRLLLRYSLKYKGRDKIPSAALLRNTIVPVRRSLESLPRSDHVVLVP
jgi:hypothetical protein